MLAGSIPFKCSRVWELGYGLLFIVCRLSRWGRTLVCARLACRRCLHPRCYLCTSRCIARARRRTAGRRTIWMRMACAQLACRRCLLPRCCLCTSRCIARTRRRTAGRRTVWRRRACAWASIVVLVIPAIVVIITVAVIVIRGRRRRL
jgi:hypothetical protein